MKFQDFINNLDCKYELECHEGGKIIRIKRPTKFEVNGVSAQMANDLAYYFDNEDNLVSQIGEEFLDTNIILHAMNSENFEIIDGNLIRKKI